PRAVVVFSPHELEPEAGGALARGRRARRALPVDLHLPPQCADPGREVLGLLAAGQGGTVLHLPPGDGPTHLAAAALPLGVPVGRVPIHVGHAPPLSRLRSSVLRRPAAMSGWRPGAGRPHPGAGQGSPAGTPIADDRGGVSPAIPPPIS